jgi:hypothetical protein
MEDIGPVRKIHAILYINGRRRQPEFFRMYERLSLQDRITALLNRRTKETRTIAGWRNVGHRFETTLFKEGPGVVVCVLDNRDEFKIGEVFLPEFLQIYLNNKFEIGMRVLRKDIVEVKFVESIF